MIGEKNEPLGMELNSHYQSLRATPLTGGALNDSIRDLSMSALLWL